MGNFVKKCIDEREKGYTHPQERLYTAHSKRIAVSQL